MTKNRAMRLAALLLVAVLMSTCGISGTFAKYVTSAEAMDTARVAKFGVAIDAKGETFAKAYDDLEKNADAEVLADVKVVAPGTGGNMASMTLTGTPEVAVKVSYVADFALSDNWIANGEFYCPLKINVEGTEVNGLNYINNKYGFESAVEALINGWTKTYNAGTDLSTVEADSVSVSWEWPFSTSAENDVKDTALGNQAAAGNPATVTLSIKTTVEQVD